MTIGDLRHLLDKNKDLPDDMEIVVNVSDYYTVGTNGDQAKTSRYEKNATMQFTHFINKDFNKFTLNCSLENGYDENGYKTKFPKITFRNK
jgi:hypothetical protein